MQFRPNAGLWGVFNPFNGFFLSERNFKEKSFLGQKKYTYFLLNLAKLQYRKVVKVNVFFAFSNCSEDTLRLLDILGAMNYEGLNCAWVYN